jgi:hypothetical protein
MFKRLVLAGICAASLFSADAATTRFHGFDFASSVISDSYGRFSEISKNGSPYLQVQEGAGYSIVVSNPLPVRVAVAVSIDGLNSIDGKRTSPDDAQKWIIEAHGSLTLRGWQTDRSSLRRFVFTSQNESYAQWKGEKDKKKYTRNLGVIGVAYFWNRAELEAALHPPMPFASRSEECMREKSFAGAPASRAAADEAEPAKKAGTGMGQKENNNVIDVEFHYDTGMYRTAEVLSMYYEFAAIPPQPLPFIDNDRKEFAPEM